MPLDLSHPPAARLRSHPLTPAQFLLPTNEPWVSAYFCCNTAVTRHFRSGSSCDDSLGFCHLGRRSTPALIRAEHTEIQRVATAGEHKPVLEWVGTRRGPRSASRVGRGPCLFRNPHHPPGPDPGVTGQGRALAHGSSRGVSTSADTEPTSGGDLRRLRERSVT